MQVDIGIGDSVYPEPRKLQLPALLDLPTGEVLCYPLETVVSEKLEAIISLGMINSRLKDYYDLWRLSHNQELERAQLPEALRRTCEKRGTKLTTSVPGLSDEFAEKNAAQWRVLISRSGTPTNQRGMIGPSPDLKIIILDLRGFLIPLLSAALAAK